MWATFGDPVRVSSSVRWSRSGRAVVSGVTMAPATLPTFGPPGPQTNLRPKPAVLNGFGAQVGTRLHDHRSEEHTSELQSLMSISYAVFCLKKQKNKQ